MMMGFELIFIVLIAGAIAYVLGWRPQFNQTGPVHTNQTPLEILKERYVRGEITRDQYDQMRLDLERAPAAPASQQGPEPSGV